jgi:uncharacterized membrane protein YqjE
MVNQASMSNSRRFAPPEGILGSITEFGGDMATLAELQTKLAMVDLRDSVDRAKVPFLVTSVSAVVLLASLPVLMIGLGFVIAEALQLSQGVGLLLTGGVLLIVAGVIAAVAGLRLSRSFVSFRRSREELDRNVAWIRSVISQNLGS